ncbi:hypothetical protein ACR720_04465 [Sphingomonas parapaucimobilis]|uniref:hypothetical protein n=1 Tax=Sphingomonas parapaucimobilis TaxID=28213 RepID=UPI0039EB045E
MKKVVMVALVASMVSGCAIAGGGVETPTKVPGDAYAAAWSSKPASEVQACLQRSSLPASFQARDLPQKSDAAYRTILVMGAEPTKAQNIAYHACL